MFYRGGAKLNYVAVFDIGTTAIKGVLLSEKGTIHNEYSVKIHTYYGENQEHEQNPEEWWSGVQTITNEWFEKDDILPEYIKAITFSGQMEDVILIKEGQETTKAILYSDTRASQEAEFVNERLPHLKTVTGNTIRSSTPLAKLIWIKNKGILEEQVSVVFSSKDYVIYQLTNSIVTDYVTAATTGMMDLQSRQWDKELLPTFELDALFELPELVPSEHVVGRVTERGATQTGFLKDTPVLCGAGDAGASTMGAGAISEGDCYMYLGTTGWIAVPTRDTNPKEFGIFTLAHIVPQLNIAIAPLLNVGNVHHWAVDTLIGSQDYEKFEAEIDKSPPGANGLFFLPYLHGERCPIQDSEAMGAYWGIGPKTTKADFARASLEGISYSLLQITNMLVQQEKGTITVIGGGAKSQTLCQLIADMTNKEVRVPEKSEYLPSIGMGVTAFKYLGWLKDDQEFGQPTPDKVYKPNLENTKTYQQNYETYLKLYPAMVPIYR